MVTTAPYGSWRSPIGVEDLTAGSTGLDAVRVDGDDLYWLESRPDQGGRVSLWRRAFAGGEATELTPAPTNVRTRVNEYGGGEYGVRDGVVVVSDLADGRLRRIDPDGTVTVLTAEGPVWYGDPDVHPSTSSGNGRSWERGRAWERKRHRRRRPRGPPGGGAGRARRGGDDPGRRSRSTGRRRTTSTPSPSWPPARTSTPRRSCPTTAGSPGPSGTTRTCRGTRPPCTSPRSPTTGWAPPRPWRAGPGSRRCSRAGSGATWSSPPTAPAGGTCTSSTARPSARCTRPRPSSRNPSGCSA